jgi:hypothetical protein
MAIVILVLALAAYAYALIAEPGFRKWGLVAGAVLAAGLAVYLWQSVPETELRAERIALEELTLDRLDFAATPRGAVLSGRVRNGSDFRLREMTIEMRLFDCLEPDAEVADCPVIGEASAIARPDVPPGQLRGFTAHFVFANLPGVAGTLRWDWRVTGTRATD